jgi:hypothetical protein
MAGQLDHSPADVIRRTLIALGLGADPPALPWPIFAALEPTNPDQVITVFDTTGQDGERDSILNDRQGYEGIQVRVRSATHPVGFAKANAVYVALNQIRRRPITIGTAVYMVQTVITQGTVLPIGLEPSTKRSLFTINALVSLRKTGTV